MMSKNCFLYFFRLANGISQKQMSMLLATAQGTISKIESGKLELNYEQLSMLSTLYKVSIDYIIYNLINERRRHEKENSGQTA